MAKQKPHETWVKVSTRNPMVRVRVRVRVRVMFSQGGQGGLEFHHFGWYNVVKGGYDVIFCQSFIGGHF